MESVNLVEDNLGMSSQIATKKTAKPTIAGILLIVAGIISIIGFISFLAINEHMISMMQEVNPSFQKAVLKLTTEGTIAYYHICGTIGCILSIFTLFGGILAIKRKLWVLTIICGIIGIIASILAIIPIIFSIPAVILVIISKKEFKNGYEGYKGIPEEKSKSILNATAIIAIGFIVIIAFVLGALFGFVLHDIVETKGAINYQYETGENILKNSDFENGTSQNPMYWFKAMIPNENLTLSWDDEIAYQGNRSVCINNSHVYNYTVINNWAQNIYEIPQGRALELSCYIKTQDAEHVEIMIQCWDENWNYLEYGSTSTPEILNGTNDWKIYKTSISSVPYQTKIITVRLGLIGTGKVWFDDAELVVK